MSFSAIILNEHTDPKVLHMCAKTHPTAISTLNLIAMHMPATNMPLIAIYM